MFKAQIGAPISIAVSGAAGTPGDGGDGVVEDSTLLDALGIFWCKNNG